MRGVVGEVHCEGLEAIAIRWAPDGLIGSGDKGWGQVMATMQMGERHEDMFKLEEDNESGHYSLRFRPKIKKTGSMIYMQASGLTGTWQMVISAAAPSRKPKAAG